MLLIYTFNVWKGKHAMSRQKGFDPRIDELEGRVVLSRLSITTLTADVKQAAKAIKGTAPLTSFTVLHSLVKKPATLNLAPGGQNAALYTEIASSPSLEQFAAALLAGASTGSTTGSTQQLTFSSSTDLDAALNTVTNAAYQVQKNANGTGTVGLALQDRFNPSFATFETLALTFDHSPKLAKAMSAIGADWSRIIHSYSINLSTTNTFTTPVQPPPTNNFPLGTYVGTYSIVVDVRNLGSGLGQITTVNSSGTMTVKILSYDSLDNQASAMITLSNYAGNTLTAPIEGVIGEGRDINVIAFNLGYQGNNGFLSLSIGGTFNGTTMVMTLLQAENQYGLDDDSAESNGPFDLTLT
jgi:hypothetical protein